MIKVSVEIDTKDLHRVCATLKNVNIRFFNDRTFVAHSINKDELSALSKNNIKWKFSNG